MIQEHLRNLLDNSVRQSCKHSPLLLKFYQQNGKSKSADFELGVLVNEGDEQLRG